MNSEEEKYMLRCIQLAQNGLCNTAPNPMVGAVIVCDGKIIGEGYHVRCGEAHAEVNAIRSVKDTSLLKRSTIYVSLEPCSHYGKTPPCADLIIEKQIPRIVIIQRTVRIRVFFFQAVDDHQCQFLFIHIYYSCSFPSESFTVI